MKLFLTSLLIILFFTNCKKDTYHIYSLDKKNCITVKDIGKIRYIIDGKHSSVPNDNYIKLDISGIASIGDGLAGCWNNGNFKWDIVNDKSIIIENKLDPAKFRFSNTLPVDDRGIPTQNKYRNNNCFTFDFLRGELLPDQGAIIE
ncbi:hypothetical protein [Aquimarina algicola]|uniref:Uncharacterized protein n=1 Tax=Aquimarina algicola TaxID=2589995 RepID=A0A504JF91_9FLAO|nr:hypothetical protein [Aquimarina algicola]TPN87382.1 hypothetical protein FHK87_07295 [Aquimarina algicola]